LLGEREVGPGREAALAALNGVLGDVLHDTGNPLAITMQLRRRGKPLDLRDPALGRTVVVLVHGSSMNDLQWERLGHHHGAALERDLGVTAIELHYNSGLHTSTNGAQFAELLEATFAQWPVPLEALMLVGHSMGGLVIRSACQAGEQHRWRRPLRAVVTLGTPHHGAPLEQGGAWVEFLLGLFPQSAPLKKLAHLRSAGVTDLRYGNVRDEDWKGRDRFSSRSDTRLPTPLPAEVACFAVAATRSKTHVKRLLGDGLVPVDSALGRHADATRALAFPREHTLIAWGAGHLDLLNRAEVYDALRDWLTSCLRRSRS
jgi:pimeloyl-ACP methyl ester carboxylesterase